MEVATMKIAVKSDMGETLNTVELKAKTFSTGSRGFSGSFKVENGGKKYQVGVNAVEVHSKPKK